MKIINLNPWSYTYIRKLAEEATILAQQEGLRPALAHEVVKNYRHSRRLNIPLLGEYLPEGWQRIKDEPVFVDLTGKQEPGTRMAVTAFEVFRRAEDLCGKRTVYGFGLIEQGQTQALLAIYRKETDGKKNNRQRRSNRNR